MSVVLKARLLGLSEAHWLASIGCAALIAGLASPDAAAQVGARIAAEPPSAEIRSAPPVERVAPPELAAAAAVARGSGNEVFYDLTIKYTPGTIYNPATGTDDAVNLRSYVGDVTSPLIPFVGPLVDIWPGETLRLTLHNELPTADPSCPAPQGDPDIPHCFNTTNLHAHGLWVSPEGNSDNVLLSINPGVDFQYEYNIPSDHPAGTYWYHSHLHGSTALQVSSGMAGAIIIHGDRLPSALPGGALKTGDIDTLLRTPDGEPFTERVVLFQQIAYACRDANGQIKTNPNANNTWLCDPGDVGGVEGYDQFGPGTWNTSGRYTSINGQVIPTFTGVAAGSVERWRLIHAGVRDTIKLRFRKLEPGAETVAYRAVDPAARQAFVDQQCTGAPLSEFAMASDGLTRKHITEQTDTVLQPGYREDLLMVFPDPGTYCMIDETLEPSQTVDGQPSGRELLGYVEVGAGTTSGDPAAQVILDALVAAAEALMPEPIRVGIVADLQNGLGLSAFIDQPDIETAELTGYQTLGFRIVISGLAPQQKGRFEIGTLGQEIGSGKLALIGSQPYDPNRIDRTLMLGGVDQWTLSSFFVGHPFHIHVNPFQIVSIVDSSGTDVSGPGDPNANQYANLKGVWKDTLFTEQDYVITVRTRYRRYIGDYVLHCHILDHEDQGMMQNVRIAIPDGHGGLAAASHH